MTDFTLQVLIVAMPDEARLIHPSPKLRVCQVACDRGLKAKHFWRCIHMESPLIQIEDGIILSVVSYVWPVSALA